MWYGYGGDPNSFPLREVAISEDASRLFVLTSVLEGAWYSGVNSRVQIYENDSTYGWTEIGEIESSDNANWNDAHWRHLQCNADGDQFGFIRTQGFDSSANSGDGAYRGWIRTYTGNSAGDTWTANSGTFGHDPNTTGGNPYGYKFSRNLRTVAAHYLGHSQGQTSMVGKVEILKATGNGSSYTWSLGGSALGLVQNSKLRLQAINSDGTKFVATNGSIFNQQNSQAFRYTVSTNGQTVTRTTTYTVPALEADQVTATTTHHNANYAAISDDGNRVAVTYGKNYHRLTVIE